jgi:hypothetical protein
VKVTGDPFIGAHITIGSVPTLSVVTPAVFEVAAPGKDTGTGTAQLFPFAVVTVTAVMVEPL